MYDHTLFRESMNCEMQILRRMMMIRRILLLHFEFVRVQRTHTSRISGCRCDSEKIVLQTWNGAPQMIRQIGLGHASHRESQLFSRRHCIDVVFDVVVVVWGWVLNLNKMNMCVLKCMIRLRFFFSMKMLKISKCSLCEWVWQQSHWKIVFHFEWWRENGKVDTASSRHLFGSKSDTEGACVWFGS